MLYNVYIEKKDMQWSGTDEDGDGEMGINLQSLENAQVGVSFR